MLRNFPSRSIRPRPIDVSVPLPVIHLKENPVQSQASERNLCLKTKGYQDERVDRLGMPRRKRTITIYDIEGFSKESYPLLDIAQGAVADSLSERAELTFDDSNVCGICGTNGELLRCDGCPNSYHLSCVGLTVPPRGLWLCNNSPHDEIYHECQRDKEFGSKLVDLRETLAAPSSEEEKKDVPVPNCKIVEDYEVMNQEDFMKPDAYIIYRRNLECLTRSTSSLHDDYYYDDNNNENMIIDYEVDSDDERFIENLKNESGLYITEDAFERIIFTLEVAANDKKGKIMISSSSDSLMLQTTEETGCCICGDEGYDDNNLIVFCDGCDIAVHQLCYGIQSIPSNEWLCQSCSSSSSSSSCVDSKHDHKCCLCNRTGGALKKTTDDKWVHLVCSLWIPGIIINDLYRMELIDVSNVPFDKINRKCVICDQYGSCIQCKDRQCYLTYHPSCSLHAKYFMHGHVTKSNQYVLTSYCADHSQAKLKKKQSNDIMMIELRSVGNNIKSKIMEQNGEIQSDIMELILNYWINKRMNRKQSLVRSLQNYTDSFNLPSSSSSSDDKKKKSGIPSLKKNTKDNYIQMKQLRQQLERARTMFDMIKKREDLKKERIESIKDLFDFQLSEYSSSLSLSSFDLFDDLSFPFMESDDMNLLTTTTTRSEEDEEGGSTMKPFEIKLDFIETTTTTSSSLPSSSEFDAEIRDLELSINQFSKSQSQSDKKRDNRGKPRKNSSSSSSSTTRFESLSSVKLEKDKKSRSRESINDKSPKSSSPSSLSRSVSLPVSSSSSSSTSASSSDVDIPASSSSSSIGLAGGAGSGSKVVGEALNLHCHHCKKRRPRCAICPHNSTHRYCQNCVRRHFGLDYELLASQPLTYWKKGCPKCLGNCPCAVCRNTNFGKNGTGNASSSGGNGGGSNNKRKSRSSSSRSSPSLSDSGEELDIFSDDDDDDDLNDNQIDDEDDDEDDDIDIDHSITHKKSHPPQRKRVKTKKSVDSSSSTTAVNQSSSYQQQQQHYPSMMSDPSQFTIPFMDDMNLDDIDNILSTTTATTPTAPIMIPSNPYDTSLSSSSSTMSMSLSNNTPPMMTMMMMNYQYPPHQQHQLQQHQLQQQQYQHQQQQQSYCYPHHHPHQQQHQQQSSTSSSSLPVHSYCEICLSGTNDDKIVICDTCDRGYHTNCLPVPIPYVPIGSWICHNCQPSFYNTAPISVIPDYHSRIDTIHHHHHHHVSSVFKKEKVV